MKPTPTPATPPAASQTAPPEVNPFPPEFMQPPEPPPPPPQADAEPIPQAPPHPQQHRQRSARSSGNPFAHMQTLNFSPPSRPQRSAGLRNSRSIDMEEGPVISGGQLHDAVTHVIGPGGPEDYMALLSEYIETHKYYPESAAAAGEQGMSAVRVVIMRDGSVRSVQLVESAGSRTLDLAWEGVFQSGRLPAFTDDMKQNELTLTLSLDYTLIYR
jgi:protein TonB